MLIMTGVQLEMACGIHTSTWVVAATTFSTYPIDKAQLARAVRGGLEGQSDEDSDWRFSDRGWIVSGNDQLNGGYATESPVFPAKSFYG
jgi:hypothetical protein